MSWIDDQDFGEDFGEDEETILLRFSDKKAETDRARLLVFNGEELWLPKSLTWDFEQTGKGFDKSGTVEVPLWWAEENDLT